MNIIKVLTHWLYCDIYMNIKNPDYKARIAVLFTVIPMILIRILSWVTPVSRLFANVFSFVWPIFILMIPSLTGKK